MQAEANHQRHARDGEEGGLHPATHVGRRCSAHADVAAAGHERRAIVGRRHVSPALDVAVADEDCSPGAAGRREFPVEFGLQVLRALGDVEEGDEREDAPHAGVVARAAG